MFLATTLSSESWLGLFLDCDTCDTWLPRLLSGDLPLTLLELGSLGGLVAAAWLLPSKKVDVKGSWSRKELAAFLCTKEGPWRLRFFDPCNGDFMGFKQQRWRLGFHEISAGFLIRHWNHSLFFRYTTKLGIVHHQKWDATNRHGDLEQLKIGEMHIRYHKKWLIYHGVLEWWNRDLEVGAFWATRISRIYLVYIVLPWASNLQVFFWGKLVLPKLDRSEREFNHICDSSMFQWQIGMPFLSVILV